MRNAQRRADVGWRANSNVQAKPVREGLTAKQMETARHHARGATVIEIGELLGLSPSAIYSRLDLACHVLKFEGTFKERCAQLVEWVKLLDKLTEESKGKAP